MGILYTASLATAIVFGPQNYAFARQMTLVRPLAQSAPCRPLPHMPLTHLIPRSTPFQNVLYGIFPAIALGYGLTWAHHLWMKRPLKRFTDPANAELPLKKVYKFTSDGERGGVGF